VEVDGPMMQQEEWMNLQEFRPLADAGVPWSEIARLAGCVTHGRRRTRW